MEPPPIQTPPDDTIDGYQFVADKVGFVPNTRKSDNAYQAKFIAYAAVFCGAFGGAYFVTSGSGPWWAGAVIGLLAGLLLGVIASGAILAVKNLNR